MTTPGSSEKPSAEEADQNDPSNLLPLRVSDVRHYSFCPRVIWHRSVMGLPDHETPKMEKGRRAEVVLGRLEKRRGLRRYHLEQAERRFGVWLESKEHALRGVCDLVLDVHVPERRLYPVEVKTTRGGLGQHHLLQLTGYALLLEASEAGSTASFRVDTGFVILLPEDRIVPVTITDCERARFLDTLREIRLMLANQRFPEPTRFRSFCPDCEYVNFCGDVL